MHKYLLSILLAVNSVSVMAMEESIQNNNNVPTSAIQACVICQEQKETTKELNSSDLFGGADCCKNLLCTNCADELKKQNLSTCPWCAEFTVQDEVSVNAKALRALLASILPNPNSFAVTTTSRYRGIPEAIEQSINHPRAHVCAYWHQNYHDNAEIKIDNAPSEAFVDTYKLLLESALREFGYHSRIERRGLTDLSLTHIVSLQGRELTAFSRIAKCSARCGNYQLGGNSMNGPMSLLTMVGIVKQIDAQLALESTNQNLNDQITKHVAVQEEELAKQTEEHKKRKELLTKLISSTPNPREQLTEDLSLFDLALESTLPLSDDELAKTQDETPIQKFFDCSICFDQQPITEMKQLACGHEYCKECIIELINLFKKERQTKYLECPNSQCKRPLTEHDIRELTGSDSSAIDLLGMIRLQEWLATQSNAKQCPMPDCTYMFLAGDQNQVVTCPSCLHEYCSSCLALHNPAKISCATFKSSLHDDKGSMQLKYSTTKPCPRCDRAIEKGDGCKFINCTYCKKEFCWECLHACVTPHQVHPCQPISFEEANKKFMVRNEVAIGDINNNNNASAPAAAEPAAIAPVQMAPVAAAIPAAPQHMLMPYIQGIEHLPGPYPTSKVSICFRYQPMSKGLFDTYVAMINTLPAVQEYFNRLYNRKKVANSSRSGDYSSQNGPTIHMNFYQRDPNMPGLVREDIEELINLIANQAPANSKIWKDQARKYGC